MISKYVCSISKYACLYGRFNNVRLINESKFKKTGGMLC